MTVRLRSGKFTATDNGKIAADGIYAVKGNKITFRDTGGPHACPGPGTYKFKLKGKTLKFTKVSDPNPACVARVIVLTSSTWTKGG